MLCPIRKIHRHSYAQMQGAVAVIVRCLDIILLFYYLHIRLPFHHSGNAVHINEVAVDQCHDHAALQFRNVQMLPELRHPLPVLAAMFFDLRNSLLQGFHTGT